MFPVKLFLVFSTWHLFFRLSYSGLYGFISTRTGLIKPNHTCFLFFFLIFGCFPFIKYCVFRIYVCSLRGQNQTSCADPKSFVRGGPTLTTFFFIIIYFLVGEGREDPRPTISGPSSARQRNAIKWRFADVPMMAQH